MAFVLPNSIADKVKEAASQTNMNEASKGVEFTPPAEGLVRLRFVGYIECGKHDKVYKGDTKQKEFVKLIFEASGPKHPPREDGSPILFELSMAKSLSEKSGLFKLFRKMNPTASKTHMAELLGDAFIANVIHNKVGEGDQQRTYANLTDVDGNYTIRLPQVDNVDPETGETTRVNIAVAEPVSPIRCFLWDYADKEQWDSLFIDGMYEARTDDKGKETSPARSKNKYQLYIMAAHNWVGSPMQEILFAGGEADIPDAEKPAGVAGDASSDPLEGAG